jgi:hypothetical protein
METEPAKIYHHHTPRAYLLPWADRDECIAWFGYGKVNRSGLTVVGGENDFYKLKELTERDIASIRDLIQTLPEGGRKGHEDLLNYYVLPTRLKRDLERRIAAHPEAENDPQVEEARRHIEVLISNLNENYHASIERRFWPYLKLIAARDFSFLDDAPTAGDFFHGLAVQYLGTKAVRERAKRSIKVIFDDLERVWDLLSHIFAVVMGGSLMLDRGKFQIIVLDNATDVPFITSDQPIVNMLTDGKSFDAPDRMELYYPLSPSQAMLLLEKTTPTAGINQNVSIDEAHRYNGMMYDHSAYRIFSNSDEYLRFFKQCIDSEKSQAPEH